MQRAAGTCQQANRYQLEQEQLDKDIETKSHAFALYASQLDQQLAQVKKNSDEELSLLQQKLRLERDAELNVKNLTLKQKQTADLKYETDSNKLAEDFNKARILAAYDAELAGLSRRLILAQRGSQQETELRVQALEKQREKELAALDERQDNTEKAALIRANTDRQIQDARYAEASAAVERLVQREKNALDEKLATGKLKQADYDKAVLDADVQNAQVRLNAARAFGQQTEQLDQKFTEAKIARLKGLTETEREEQAKRMQFAEGLTTQLVGLFQETVATTGATIDDFARKAFAVLIDSVQGVIIAEQIKIIAQAFSSKESLATYGILGFVKSAAIIAASTLAAEGLKLALTPPKKQFSQGGIASGPSHEFGGIDLLYRGRPAGIEIEGQEVILTKGVTANPLLLSLASTVNQLAGGRALTASLPTVNFAALGAITRPAAVAYLRQQAQPIDYERLAQATARALRQSPPITRWVDYKAAETRNGFTDSVSSS